ncbi:unnamed protein product, partial [Polarella glacialis]
PAGCLFASLLAALFLDAAGLPMRQELLNLARQRLEVWYADKTQLEDPKEKDGVSYQLSKEDKACGGDGVPLTFMEFDIDGVRPVDAFNVLAAYQNQTSWDSTCADMELIGELRSRQAFGLTAHFSAAPLSSRQIVEWQVASANFSTEEFWVVFSTLENDELKQLRAPDPKAVQLQNCLAAYRLTRKVGSLGVHVLMTQQVNSHPWPLSGRAVANAAMGPSVGFAQAMRGQTVKQAKFAWLANRTVLPDWMLAEGSSCAPPQLDSGLRKSIVDSAAAALSSDSGSERPSQKLPDGEAMQIWQRMASCGSAATPSAEVPRWRAEFRIPGALPEEVFNVLVAKVEEARWNPVLSRINLTGFHRGARGVHEEFIPPVKFWRPRELWEWQASRHDLGAGGSYLVALVSVEDPSAPPFSESKAVAASQCMAAYEVSGTPEGASLVRMVSHINPNIGALSRLQILWEGTSERMLGDWAARLAGEARKLAAARRSPLLRVDAAALALLWPPPPDRNDSATIGWVLQLAATKATGFSDRSGTTKNNNHNNNHNNNRSSLLRGLSAAATASDFAAALPWQRAFASLDLPKALWLLLLLSVVVVVLLSVA